MFDSFVFLPLSTRAYFKGRAYIKIILKNHARSYFAGRSYYQGNTVTWHAVFPLILNLLRKCRKRCENAWSRCENAVENHKQQCRLLRVFVRTHTKKKVIAYIDCQEFSFLYRRALKQMKQKSSSGIVVHLFLRLSVMVLLHEVSKKQRYTLRRMKKKWRCAGRDSKTKTP